MTTHNAIKVTRTVTFSYVLKPGAYQGCSTVQAIRRETEHYDLQDLALTLKHKNPDEVDMKVSFEVLDS